MGHFLKSIALLPMLMVVLGQLTWVQAQDVDCVKPKNMKTGEVTRNVPEPKGGATCTKTGIFQEIIWQCEHRYCCELPCDCHTVDLLQESDICHKNESRYCYLQHHRLTSFKRVCCEGYIQDPITNLCVENITETTVETTTEVELTTQKQKEPNVIMPRDAPVVQVVHVSLTLLIVAPLAAFILLLLIILCLLLLCRCRKKKAAAAAAAASGVENPGYEEVTYDAAGGALAAPLPIKLPIGEKDGKEAPVFFVEPDMEKKGFPDDLPGALADPPPPYSYQEKDGKTMAIENPYLEAEPLPEKVKLPDHTYVNGNGNARLDDKHTYANDTHPNHESYPYPNRDNLLNEVNEDIYEEIKN